MAGISFRAIHELIVRAYAVQSGCGDETRPPDDSCMEERIALMAH
jgi:hypothetical protein